MILFRCRFRVVRRRSILPGEVLPRTYARVHEVKKTVVSFSGTSMTTVNACRCRFMW